MAIEEWMKSIVEEYISQRKEINESVLKEGMVPKSLCELCYTHNTRQFIDNLTSEEKEVAIGIARQVWEYKIINVKRDNIFTLSGTRTGFSVRSLKQIRDITKNRKEFNDQVFESIQTDEEGKTIYTYSISTNSSFFKSSFLKSLFRYFNGGLAFCQHFEGLRLKRDVEGRSGCLSKEEHVYTFNDDQIGTIDRNKKQWTRTLIFLCDECYNEISKRACPDSLRFAEYLYQNHGCLWRDVLFLSCLKKKDKEFRLIGEYNPIVVVEPDKVLISFTHKIDEDIISKVVPNSIILFGTQKQMIPFIKMGIDIIAIDKENIIYYDSTKEVRQDINQVIEHIVKDLDIYYDKERGNDYDRYKKAFMRIGGDLGFVTQEEASSKGSRLDCVWIDRKGNVFAAIEIETKGYGKKDIVSTWEREPQVAIILSRAKTDKSILDLTKYALLKNMPHSLILINTETNMLYYFEKNDIVKTRQLVLQEIEQANVKEI